MGDTKNEVGGLLSMLMDGVNQAKDNVMAGPNSAQWVMSFGSTKDIDINKIKDTLRGALLLKALWVGAPVYERTFVQHLVDTDKLNAFVDEVEALEGKLMYHRTDVSNNSMAIFLFDEGVVCITTNSQLKITDVSAMMYDERTLNAIGNLSKNLLPPHAIQSPASSSDEAESNE